MPHRAHDGDGTRSHRTYQFLVVEGQEVVRRTSASSQDDDIDAAHLGDLDQCLANGPSRIGPLHHRGRQQDACTAATEGHADHVVDHRSCGAGHDSHDARVGRERTFAFGGKQPLGLELRFETRQGFEQRAASSRFGAIGAELKPSPRRPERGTAPETNPRPIPK